MFSKPLDWSCLSSLLTDSVLPERGDWGLLLLLSPFPLLLPPSLFLLSVLLLRWPLLPPSHLSGFNGCVSLLPAALECCFICPVIIYVHLFAFLSRYIFGENCVTFFVLSFFPFFSSWLSRCQLTVVPFNSKWREYISNHYHSSKQCRKITVLSFPRSCFYVTCLFLFLYIYFLSIVYLCFNMFMFDVSRLFLSGFFR